MIGPDFRRGYQLLPELILYQEVDDPLKGFANLFSLTRRNVYFGKWCETEIYRREDLVPGKTLDGPAVVEQADATIVVEPGMTASVDTLNNLLVEVCP